MAAVSASIFSAFARSVVALAKAASPDFSVVSASVFPLVAASARFGNAAISSFNFSMPPRNRFFPWPCRRPDFSWLLPSFAFLWAF